MYAAVCSKGIEDICQSELLSLGVDQARQGEGTVYFEASEERVNSILKNARTVNFLYHVDDETPWKVFSSGHFMSKIKKVSRRALYLRSYRIYNHPSALLPTVAAALLLTTDTGKDLLDPFAGGGTILIEDALYMKDEFSKKDHHRIQGIEINPHHLSGAVKNAKRAEVDELIRFIRGDCTRIKFDEKFSRMVTNPPYGVRGAKMNRILGLYDRFMDNLDNLLCKGAQSIIVTTEWKQLSGMIGDRGYRITNIRLIRHRKLWIGAVYFNL